MKNLVAIIFCFLGHHWVMGQCADINVNFTDSVSGTTVYFTDATSANNGWAIAKRYWAYGDSIVDSIVLNPTHVYAQPGSYTVCLTIKGELAIDTVTTLHCTETVCHQVTALTTGIEPVSETEQLIYPNPFRSHFRLVPQGESRDPIDIRLFNVLGQLKLSQTDLRPNQVVYPGGDLSEGLYIVELTQGGVKKIIKVKKEG